MSFSLIAGALWVIAATITALLPMRLQTVPGMALLFGAPVLLIWIGYTTGWIWAVLGLLAFLSMFRNPLRYVFCRLTGRPFTLPPEVLARLTPEQIASRPELVAAAARAKALLEAGPDGTARRGAIRREPAAGRDGGEAA